VANMTGTEPINSSTSVTQLILCLQHNPLSAVCMQSMVDKHCSEVSKSVTLQLCNVTCNGIPVRTEGSWEKVPIYLWLVFKGVAIPFQCSTLQTLTEIDMSHPGPGSSRSFYFRYVNPLTTA